MPDMAISLSKIGHCALKQIWGLETCTGVSTASIHRATTPLAIQLPRFQMYYRHAPAINKQAQILS